MTARGSSERWIGDASPIRPDEFGFEQARHLLWRAGFGGTAEEIHALAALGPGPAVDRLLEVEKIAVEPVAADLFDSDIMRPPTPEERATVRRARQTQDEDLLARIRLERQRRQREDRRQVRGVQRWWLARMIETPRPLEEKMTLFWHGHFATSYRTIENSYHMFVQNQLFRANALGSYADLMFGIIRDPAMLAYLDNNNSRRGRPNENLARELMELFSLGVGNYTERDVKEGARALTGYTFRDNEFHFAQETHDFGGKTILGRTGNFDGDDFVRIILEQPACSRFMAHKLSGFFAADLPEGEREIEAGTSRVLRAMSEEMRRSRYAVRPVLRRLFLSRHFYSPAVAGEHGDLHTFRVCCRVVRGFDLTDDEAMSLLREWNDCCAPPWSERELLEKVRNARRYGREPFGGLVGGSGVSSSANA